ncbi:MAG: hypothetical protein A2Y25_05975 [Candidatus Melainabacteria bacterium GWF2_37_15]|nr:MAG: hypothetical protein A2Y25_05975 [Candidatus Melainabacteria bacterium GWF2_37_15]
MKKLFYFLTIFTLFFCTVSCSLAQETQKLYGNVEENLELVNTIGQKILKSNNLSDKIKFLVAEEDHVNAYANIKDEVYIYRGLLKVVETEDELAGVISHEVGHIKNEHVKKQAFLQIIMKPITSSISYITDKLWINKLAEYMGILTIMKVSRSAEYQADSTGADLMVKAGYNPLGMISVLNRITENQLDIISTHPSGDKRLVHLYDYLSSNYAEQVKNGYPTKSYAEFKAYMDEVLKNRNK